MAGTDGHSGAPLISHLVAWVGGRVFAASLHGRRRSCLGNTHLTVGKQKLKSRKAGCPGAYAGWAVMESDLHKRVQLGKEPVCPKHSLFSTSNGCSSGFGFLIGNLNELYGG